MPNPTDVNPNNFKVKTVLFDNGSFSVVIGDWIEADNVLAMRWNGEKDAGYPKAFGNPMWFIVDNDLRQPIIQALMMKDKNLIQKILDTK